MDGFVQRFSGGPIGCRELLFDDFDRLRRRRNRAGYSPSSSGGATYLSDLS
jgi:hypothetical protein